jgi:hypothetical protein
MRVIFFDYKGTLDRVKDPVAFINALKAHGDFTILHSATLSNTIEKDFPGLPACFDLILSKGGTDFEREVSDTPGATEVILVDDECFMASLMEDFDSVHACDVSWRFLHANAIESLLPIKSETVLLDEALAAKEPQATAPNVVWNIYNYREGAIIPDGILKEPRPPIWADANKKKKHRGRK